MLRHILLIAWYYLHWANLVPRAHVPLGQHQDTELWNNQQSSFPEPSCLLLIKFDTAPCIRLAREIWFDQSGFSRWGKIHCRHVNVSWQERHWNQATFLIGDCIKYSLKGIYNSQNHFTLQKVKNMKHLHSCVSKLLIWRQIVRSSSVGM